MRIKTKEQRLEILKAEFDRVMSNDNAKKETYKALTIFTFMVNGNKYLKVYSGTSTKPIVYTNYGSRDTSILRRSQRIEELKKTQDIREEHKAKRKNQKSTHANCASTLKAELQKAFKGVKFSVTSDSFSMGDSVRVKWTDGPTKKMVEEIADKYQYGHFNGMEDIYEYSNSRDDIPQSKYVFCSRELSEQIKEQASTNEMLHIFEKWAENDRYRRGAEGQRDELLSHTSLPLGAKIVGIETTGKTSGSAEIKEFYRFVIEAPATNPLNTLKPAKVETSQGEVKIIRYSEKAIAVIGDTKPIKDKLKQLGGKFNFRLSCGAGWIFPSNKLEAIQSALS